MDGRRPVNELLRILPANGVSWTALEPSVPALPYT
jgi:hypothetical protein